MVQSYIIWSIAFMPAGSILSILFKTLLLLLQFTSYKNDNVTKAEKEVGLRNTIGIKCGCKDKVVL